MVYDITDRESFENLNSWLIEIEKNANKNVFKILIGNKCDLEDKRKVTFQEGKDFADSNGMKFLETSAKTATKVEEAFQQLTNEIINSSISKDKILDKKIIIKLCIYHLVEQIFLQRKREDVVKF